MQEFKLVTAIDIGLDQDRAGDHKKNYESLVQTLQLKTQIEPRITFSTTNKKAGHPLDLNDNDPVWVFVFAVEQTGYFELNIVSSDLDYVPCILGLGESKKVKTPLYMTSGDNKNTVIKNYQLNI